MNFTQACCFTGFFGDLGLQFLDQGNWGLTDYFEKHGNPDAPFLAAGMMGIFGGAFVLYMGRKPDLKECFLYGGSLDLVFRFLRPMKSLDAYYEKMPIYLSFIWGGIPLAIALMFTSQ